MIWDFSGISAALAWNSSNIFIHSRNALETKPTKVASVYSSQSEIIHVLLSLVRSWRKLSARTHWHIFGAFHTSQWNYTRNMNLAHTACARCAVCTGYTHTRPSKRSHLNFGISHSRHCYVIHFMTVCCIQSSKTNGYSVHVTALQKYLTWV